MSSLYDKDMKIQSGGFSLKEAWDKAKEFAKSVHDVAQKRKVISGALKDMGFGHIGRFVDKQFGYGKNGQSGGSVKDVQKAVEKEFSVKLGGRKRKVKVVADKKPIRRRTSMMPRSSRRTEGVPTLKSATNAVVPTGGIMSGGKGSPVMKVHI